jgi:hypothetical protein
MTGIVRRLAAISIDFPFEKAWATDARGGGARRLGAL